jgi:hypothetical protein
MQPPAKGDIESGPDPDSGSTPASSSPGPCVKGQVTPNEVAMLGDSYLDHPWGNVGPTLMMVANAKYRHYYIEGPRWRGAIRRPSFTYRTSSIRWR